MGKKVLSIFGTRPEAIKMAPVVKEIGATEGLTSLVCVTAQHREMLDQVLDLFEISPDFDLNIMKPGQDLTDITVRILRKLKLLLREVKPDLILVHGDTTTSFVAALAGFYEGIPIGHVEAGLRTYNLVSPFPEEGNRQLTSRLASLHFAPTAQAQQNLLNEQVPEARILVTGNTVIDALHMVREKLTNPVLANSKIDRGLREIVSSAQQLLLVTGHRRENFGDGFLKICKGLQLIAMNNPELQIVYPVHLNPNVQKPVFSLLQNLPNVHLIEPLDYLPFVFLLSHATIVLTDSGGVQEEAPSFGKPVLVMRDTTERPEAVDAGTVKLVGTDSEKIVYWVEKLLHNQEEYLKMSKAHNPYGDGLAAQKIAQRIKEL
ncbi:MAG: UDP-N-acetylglucosamine 2-epimerase (non-hydrolyzing) [SAR324 cluster bacterium]|uniref:UDP-N-acetylglucosamine 2-epimerase (non-hydrolyzing) n=1 Tax=SAR324 cluster bacterium TaxID=2024889 RepID=A0A2A4SXF9_9DELT|nr:MAG: UDP-N-acetylglucosamine 2-epimerase (non-hydrolyzing) [SAR324 cluster bacterium]